MKAISLLITPPEDQSRAVAMVRDFLEKPGKKIVCGGATSRMVEDYLGQKINLDLSKHNGTLPPAGYLKGVDLVTEGRFTLQRVLEILAEGYSDDKGDQAATAADTLFALLQEAEKVEIFFGSAVHGDFHGKPAKKRIVGQLADHLTEIGKKVTVYNY